MTIETNRSSEIRQSTAPLPTSLTALARTRAELNTDLEIRCGDKLLTAIELSRRAAALAGGLDAWGVRPGDHVAIWMRNSIEWVETWFGCALAGAVIVPLNTRFTPAETEYILRHSDSRWLIWRPGDGALDAVQIAGMEKRGLRLRGRAVVADAATDAHEVPFASLRNGPALSPREDGSALGMIQYTSGSTSFPKGAMLRNDALIRNAHGLGVAWQLHPRDRVLCSNPLFHCGGSVFAFLAAYTHSASIELMDAWRVDAAIELIAQRGVTVFPGIDAAVRDLVVHGHRKQKLLSTLRLVSTAADTGLCARVAAVLQCEVSNVYGLTECSPNVCVGDLSDPLDRRIARIGRPQDGVTVQIRDLDTGTVAAPGATGEIVVRGWNVTNGYYNDSDATSRAFTDDGFLHTGDLGAIDDEGYLEFKGRAKLMIKSGGENIAIEEVEEVLRSNASVADAIVVPVPHERFGEVGFAFVRPNVGKPRETQTLLLACRERLAGFKVPKHVHWVDDLPRTGSGKVDRIGLQRLAEELLPPRERAE